MRDTGSFHGSMSGLAVATRAAIRMFICRSPGLDVVPDIRDLEPLIGRWRQVVEAPRHVEEKVNGQMTLRPGRL